MLSMTSVRERSFLLTTPEEVNEFLSRFPTSVIFKAGGCHKTMQGFAHVEAALAGRGAIHVGYIRVIESRPASNHVAELTGIVHESPQFILFVEGKPLFDLDNWDITPEALEEGIRPHLGEAEAVEELPGSDLSSYVELLEQLLEGSLSEEAFKAEWTGMFRDDTTPRSAQEVELLETLYGDVDEALITIGGAGSVKPQAELLLKELRGLHG